MNTYTAQEHAASELLREKAKHLSAGYAEPQDLEAARLALLMKATQSEAAQQGYVSRVAIINHRLIDEAKRVLNTGDAHKMELIIREFLES